jgi:hypothetical protein
MRPCRARPAMPGRGDRSAAGVRDRTDRIPRSAGSVPQRLSRAAAAPAVVHGSEEPQVTGLPARAARTICAGDSDYGPKVIQRPELTVGATAFVDGRGSRLAAGRMPPAGAGAPAASGSRSWCRRRGGTARRWRPTRGRWPGRRRAAPRTAAAVPPSAGPGPGRAKSPPDQAIEHKFEMGSATLRSPTVPFRVWVGRAGAATQRNLGDNRGQQGITNLEVSGRAELWTWAAKPLDCAFTRQQPHAAANRILHPSLAAGVRSRLAIGPTVRVNAPRGCPTG